MYCTVLYCTVLHCTVLRCTVLYCTVLYCNVLYCTVLYRFWNPLFADPRTSIARELRWALEQELQLLVSASDIKVSEARPAALAR